MHRGLFFLSPFLLWAIPGYVVLWQDPQHRAEFWVLLLAPLSFLCFNAASAMWQGGFAVGPRYLLPSLPFLSLAAGVGLAQAWRRTILRPAVIATAGWSFFAVWAETVAGQAFPDYTSNPLFDLSLPALATGNIARNAGMLLGLAGWSSLMPLALITGVGLVLLARSAPGSRMPARVSPPESSAEQVSWARP
jgi:hypothetical protein